MIWQAALAVMLFTSLASNASAEPAPTAASAERPIPAGAIRADFRELYARLRSAHFDLYARIPRPDYDRLYRRELAAIRQPETRFQVARRFQRFVAHGRIAHARIDLAYQAYETWLAGGGRAFPLSLRIVDGRAFVIGNRSGVAAIAFGDEVIAIDGRPVRAWLARARRNLSADNIYMANALIELDLPMLLWLEVGERAMFRVRTNRASINVPARTRAAMQLAARAAPPGLDLSGRDARLIGRVAYLRPGPFYNVEAAATAPYDNAAFRRFIDDAFDRFLTAGAETVLIDLRDNPGGDNSFSDIMIGWFADRPFRFASSYRIRVSPETIASNRQRLEAPGGDPSGVSRRLAALYAGATAGDAVAFDIAESHPREGRRFTGRVYVLVNRNSFSNAVAVAATIQDYGFGTIIGEETSDLASTLGAMETFTLPETGIVVGYPKAQIIRPNGNVAPRGVIPDFTLITPLRETREDPVLSQALALIATQGR